MYTRHGAGYNVRLMVIGDKLAEPRQSSVPDKLPVLTTYDELWGWSEKVIAAYNAPRPEPQKAKKPEPEVGDSVYVRGGEYEGTIRTLLGLINLMDLLGAGDVKGIGVQLGIALLTTLYGVILSNMVFKPLALRLERRTERRLALMNMILEGISMMSAGHSPGLMRETLKSFVAQIDDELSDARSGAKTANRPR